jgi:uncharacterized protein YkwD
MLKKLPIIIVILTILASAVFAHRGSITVGDSLPQIAQTLKNVITPGALNLTKPTISKSTTSSSPSTIEANATLTKSGVIQLTNQNRKENGNLIVLTENNKLDQSAEIKMKDLFAKQYFEHVSPTGVSVSNLADQVSYDYIVIGENLAMGDFTSNKDLVDAWMASPGHRANILNKRYIEIGVAVGRGMYQGREVWMAVQHFGAPKSLCSTIDESLHQKILQDEAQIKIVENDLATRPKTTNEEIDAYNTAVKHYNQLVEQVKIDISTYNAQIQAFNACAAG